MKLLKQQILIFAEGRSVKVYEVDLCEVGPEKFVVNFRYGKRGAPLKDGSKTIAPVGRAEAERTFDKLVDTKIEQGYFVEGSAAVPRPQAAAPVTSSAPAATPQAAPTPVVRPSGRDDPRVRLILERLAKTGTERRWFRREEAKPTWALERAIWRAGELGVREAEPLLLPLLGSAPRGAKKDAGGEGMRDYCVAWALGLCGSSASVPTLGKLYTDPKTPAYVQRIACEALLKLSDEGTRVDFKNDARAALPESLQIASRGSADAFSEALAKYLRAGGTKIHGVLDQLYLIDDETLRPALLAALDGAFTPALFERVRHIFKLAEYRRDAEVFGRIAYRFEKQKANFAHENYGARSGAQAAWGAHTRTYLRRRVWRTLRKLGWQGSADYVKLAVGVLLQFDDAVDAMEPRGSGSARWGRYAPYWAFNWILYAHSLRYEPGPRAKSWKVKPEFPPGAGRRGRVSLATTAEPDLDGPREEAFPRLWEQHPAGLMHLLAESRCAPVHGFAARALRACRAFCDALDLEDVLLLLAKPYEPTARLGFEIAERRYDASRFDATLLLGVARGAYAPGREKAFRWIDAQRSAALADGTLLAGLVLAPHADTRAYARRLLRAGPLSETVGMALLGRLVAAMLALGPNDEAIARDGAETVITALSAFISAASVPVICDLVAHPLAALQELGANLLARRDARSGLLPEDVLVAILQSPHASVRAIGTRMLSELSDPVLARAADLIARLASDKNADVRAAARPLLRRIAATDPAAAERAVEALMSSLLRRKLSDEAAADVLALLRTELASSLPSAEPGRVWMLLQSGSKFAQELGATLLIGRFDPHHFTLDQLIDLAGHEIVAVRQAAWAMLESDLPRARADMANVARAVDSKWDDARAWALRFLRERFESADFNVDVLVTILDSVREDVQAFGRELAQRHFREEDGPTLLLRLSEHPSRAVQLFTTNYLARYAADKTDRLEALLPYFTSVLTRINQGRVAKSRVIAFLRDEGQKSEGAARVLIDLLHRLAATISVEYRAAAIDAMMAIHRAHPAVAVPLRVHPPELRTYGVPVRV